MCLNLIAKENVRLKRKNICFILIISALVFTTGCNNAESKKFIDSFEEINRLHIENQEEFERGFDKLDSGEIDNMEFIDLLYDDMTSYIDDMKTILEDDVLSYNDESEEIIESMGQVLVLEQNHLEDLKYEIETYYLTIDDIREINNVRSAGTMLYGVVKMKLNNLENK